MKNNTPPVNSLLWSKFLVTNTFIQLRDKSISESDFIEAVCEFCRAQDHARSRLGDLLIAYENAFGKTRLLNGLISTLVLKGLASRKSCDNARSFAKKYKQEERLDYVPDAHAEEIWSIPEGPKRDKVLREFEKRLKSDRKVPRVPVVRELAVEAKRK